MIRSEIPGFKSTLPYIIVWWFLVFGLVLFSRFPALNQIVLKGIIPIIFILILSKDGLNSFKSFGLKAYIGLTIWATLSLFYSVNLPLTVSYLQTMIGCIIVWYIVDACVRHISKLHYLLLPIVSVFILHLYFALTTAAVAVDRVDYSRVEGLTNNPNALGFLLFYGVVFITYLFFTKPQVVIKGILIAVLLVFILALFQTGSRKNFIALLIFFGCIFFYRKKQRNYMPLVLGFLILYLLYEYAWSYILNNTVVGQRFITDEIETGTTARSTLILEGFNFFLSNPFLGIGLGSFKSLSARNAMSHNDYIEILSSMGIFALILYLTIYFHYFKMNKTLLKQASEEVFSFGVVAQSFIIAFLFLGLGRPTFLDPIAILILAFFYSVLRKYNSKLADSLYGLKNESMSHHKHA
ncbi:MAG TPA: O-antigen ligase family protein [Ohtaekwangia sp.]|nr:O-antigen ligase family protein [Ohtaekwangia sp.]